MFTTTWPDKDVRHLNELNIAMAIVLSLAMAVGAIFLF